MSNYNKIANWYDAIAYGVFGKSILEAQLEFIPKIPPQSTILILGGGTGAFLEYLDRNVAGCSIHFIDNSEKMIAQAKRRNVKHNQISFALNLPKEKKRYDVVITNFFLDQFSDQTLTNMVQKIQADLSPTSLWLISEFVPPTNWRQQFLLKIMYLFFRRLTAIEAKQLPDWQKAINQYGFKLDREKCFHNNFIVSQSYSRALTFKSI